MSGLTIGDLAARTGLAVSAIRFYETHGIVHPLRNAGGHRRYGAHDLRRLSFAMIAQKLGFALSEIAAEMAALPDHKARSGPKAQKALPDLPDRPALALISSAPAATSSWTRAFSARKSSTTIRLCVPASGGSTPGRSTSPMR